MNFDCIILDFDGTFTEVEKEAGPFLDAYRAEVREMVGPDTASLWLELELAVQADPGRFGWTFDGRMVAPANSDPYLRATVVTNLLFDRVGLYPDTPARQEILEGLYRRNYTKATAAFRPEAREVIERLVASGLPVWVVTNSDTDAVTDKINLLAPVGKESLEIRGNAKKYVVSEPADPDPTFDAVPEERRLEGLDRPIFLRRGHYYQLLREIWTVTGTSPERTIVAGDIYELDLALPAALGVAVHLLARDTTPEHEKRAVVADGGQVSDQLYAVLERVGIPA